jgi:hypothetical protein
MTFTVDIHHHFIPTSIGPPPTTMVSRSPANALSFMDDRGDRHAELSDTERLAVLHGAAVSLLPKLTNHPA